MRSKTVKKEPTVIVQSSGHGYYTMTVDGVFEGNYDTVKEAWDDYEQNHQAS